MHEPVLNSGWQTGIVAVPFLFMLLAGVFRLDEVFVTQRQSVRRRRPAPGIDQDGQPTVCDPDGRPSGPVKSRK
ncbi:MAG: hypothetical protein WA802_02590 [Terracidiphilus sp.]